MRAVVRTPLEHPAEQGIPCCEQGLCTIQLWFRPGYTEHVCVLLGHGPSGNKSLSRPQCSLCLFMFRTTLTDQCLFMLGELGEEEHCGCVVGIFQPQLSCDPVICLFNGICAHKVHTALILCTGTCSVLTREVAVQGLKYEKGLKKAAFRLGFLTCFPQVLPKPQGKSLAYRESTSFFPPSGWRGLHSFTKTFSPTCGHCNTLL